MLVNYTGLYINKSKWHLPNGSTVPSRDSSWRGTAVGSVIQGTGGPAVLSLLDFTLAVTWWSGCCLSFQPRFWLFGHSPLALQPSRAAGSTMLVFFSHAKCSSYILVLESSFPFLWVEELFVLIQFNCLQFQNGFCQVKSGVSSSARPSPSNTSQSSHAIHHFVV